MNRVLKGWEDHIGAMFTSSLADEVDAADTAHAVEGNWAASRVYRSHVVYLSCTERSRSRSNARERARVSLRYCNHYLGYHPLAILYYAPRLYPDLLDKVVGPITDCTLAIRHGHAGRQKAELSDLFLVWWMQQCNHS